MDTERNLLFGVVAFQNGAVDADRLAETCADWVSEPTQPLADLMVDRGLMTDEQRTEVEKAVSQELASHGGDPQATLAATMDGRSLEAIGEIASAGGVDVIRGEHAPPPQVQGGHVVLGTLSPGEADSRERYTLTHLHAKGGMGRVWLARDGALGRQIALKELRPDQSDNSIVCSRFLYEAKITAQLEHPSIVPVYELGEGECAVLHHAVRAGPHPERGRPGLPQEAGRRRGRPGRHGRPADGVRQRLPRRGLRPFARDHPPRPQGAERRAGRLRRGHRARLGPGQARRPGPAQAPEREPPPRTPARPRCPPRPGPPSPAPPAR